MQQTDDEQTKLWNGTAGRAWVEMQALLDQTLKPLEDRLVEAVAARSEGQVLDVGCGTGSTTLAVARLFGTKGRSVGIDLSEPMIALARARAERERSPASFIRGNAQSHVFEPTSFDTIISRFGVMFFDDPAAAFANLRRAARDDAELQCIVWRGAADNPFMMTAERAAAPLLPDLPARRPNAPGQFAFADRQRVEAILNESGWSGIDIQPADMVCTFAEADLIRYFTSLGPVGMILQEADARTRAQVIDTVRAAFDPYVFGAEVRYTAACWIVVAAHRNA